MKISVVIVRVVSLKRCSKNSRNRGDAAFEILRQKKQGHHHQRHPRNDFPSHHAQAIGVSRSIEAHQLLGREVGQHQRAGDVAARQRPPRQEISGGGIVPVFAGQNPGDDGHQTGEENKRTQCQNVHDSPQVRGMKVFQHTQTRQRYKEPPDLMRVSVAG